MWWVKWQCHFRAVFGSIFIVLIFWEQYGESVSNNTLAKYAAAKLRSEAKWPLRSLDDKLFDLTFLFCSFTTLMKNIWKILLSADYLIQNVVEYYKELAYVLVENAVFRLIRFKGKTSLMFAKLNSVCNTFSHWVCLSCNKRGNTSIFPHKNESNSFQLLPHLMQCLYDSYNLKTVFPPLL